MYSHSLGENTGAVFSITDRGEGSRMYSIKKKGVSIELLEHEAEKLVELLSELLSKNDETQ